MKILLGIILCALVFYLGVLDGVQWDFILGLVMGAIINWCFRSNRESNGTYNLG